MVQWNWDSAFSIAGNPGLIPGQGTKILKAVRRGFNIKIILKTKQSSKLITSDFTTSYYSVFEDTCNNTVFVGWAYYVCDQIFLTAHSVIHVVAWKWPQWECLHHVTEQTTKQDIFASQRAGCRHCQGWGGGYRGAAVRFMHSQWGESSGVKSVSSD